MDSIKDKVIDQFRIWYQEMNTKIRNTRFSTARCALCACAGIHWPVCLACSQPSAATAHLAYALPLEQHTLGCVWCHSGGGLIFECLYSRGFAWGAVVVEVHAGASLGSWSHSIRLYLWLCITTAALSQSTASFVCSHAVSCVHICVMLWVCTCAVSAVVQCACSWDSCAHVFMLGSIVKWFWGNLLVWNLVTLECLRAKESIGHWTAAYQLWWQQGYRELFLEM